MPPRRMMLAATILIGSVAGAATAATETNSHNEAVKSTRTVTTVVPAHGANSFTEAQARKRLMKAGYVHVSRLRKDNAGIWQGSALKQGASVKVGLDYKGNISVN